MRIPKRYGEGLVNKCPFCDRTATTTNNQGVSVCHRHKKSHLGELKCVCGEYVEQRKGKHGVYFFCINCGNISAKKIFEVNDVKDSNEASKKNGSGHNKHDSGKEITITPNDVEYF